MGSGVCCPPRKSHRPIVFGPISLCDLRSQDVTNTAFKNCVALVRKEPWATLTRSKMPTRHKFRGQPTWTCLTNARRLVFVG